MSRDPLAGIEIAFVHLGEDSVMDFVFLLTFLGVLTATSIAQIDQHGNPVFHSVPLSDDTTSTCIISANYYTIKNNIDNKNSSVYVNDKPSLEELIEFARTKPSYFFLVHRDKVVSHLIMVNSRVEGKKSRYSFLIMNPKTNNQVEIPAHTLGDVTEGRSYELVHNMYDDKAMELKLGPKRMCLFGNIAYSMQSLDELRAEVVELVNKYHLDRADIDLTTLSE